MRFFGVIMLSVLGFCTAAQEPQDNWREVRQTDLMYLYIGGEPVVIELNNDYAPAHAEHIRTLVKEGFYDGRDFYRVIEGFVAQAGDMLGDNSKRAIESEFEQPWVKDTPYSSTNSVDMYANETGFRNGFAIGLDKDRKSSWLLHCPGVVSLARGTDKDSATTDFAIMTGQSARHLDRNMSVFGRVVYGYHHILAIAPGKRSEGGVIASAEDRVKIDKAVMGNALAPEQQLKIQVQLTESEAFRKRLASIKQRTSDFYHFPPPAVVDACYVNVDTRVAE